MPARHVTTAGNRGAGTNVFRMLPPLAIGRACTTLRCDGAGGDVEDGLMS